MKSKLVVLVFLLFVSILPTSCGSMVKNSAMNKMTVENHAIPPDFGKNNSTLVCILQGRNSRDKYMRKHIEDNYRGKYVFLLKEELESDKYGNLDEYRYLLDYNAGSVLNTSFNTGGNLETRNLPTSSYYIYDRKMKEHYFSGTTSGMFGKLILAYSISLESVRVANSQ